MVTDEQPWNPSEHAAYVHAEHPSLGSELPLSGGNAQLGCGLVVRHIKGHGYLYFWAYEERSWGARRVWTYVGAIGRQATRTRARALLLAYHVRVRREVERRMLALQAAAAGSR